MCTKIARDHTALFVITCVFLGLLLRIPLVLWGGTPLDGDEAIMGIMAKHISSGTAFPVFFYGQTYGLSMLEAYAGALFFSIFGISTVSLHSSILFLWILGVICFCLASRRLFPPIGFWIFGLALAVNPAWLEWSFKARGFYVGGFLTAGLCTYLLSISHESRTKHRLLNATIGIMLGVLGHTHLLWLATMSPCLLLWLIHKRDFSLFILISTSFLLSYIFIYVLFVQGHYSYWSPDFFSVNALAESTKHLPSRLNGLFSEASSLSGVFWSFFCVLTIVIGTVMFLKSNVWLFASLVASCLIPFLITLLISDSMFGYRYVLSSTVPVFVLASVLISNYSKNKTDHTLSTFLLLTSLIVVAFISDATIIYKKAVNFRSQPFNEDYSVKHLTDILVDNNIFYVYSMDGLLQWGLIFQSGERIVARWLNASDRVPIYPLQVDSALYYHKPTALVGRIAELQTMKNYLAEIGVSHDIINVVDNTFFWIKQPTPQMLLDIRFELNNPDLLKY